jgi:hypothetical protein
MSRILLLNLHTRHYSLGLNFEVFSCRVPLGPPKIKKRSKNGPDAHLGNIQQIQE